ncbi:Polyferredoxin protein MvhB [uncultured archaeon]|nr:Polyferredoxin protein MvhB [uncultured archaeon]
MTKVVFFTDIKKLHKAFALFSLQNYAGKKVPVKLHMGEKGNPYFVKPELVKYVVDELKKAGANPFLFDTTVAYHGSRHTKTEYLNLAKLHGFTNKNIGCDIVIDDSGVSTLVEGRTFMVADHLKNSTHIFALSHVKGHIQSGMGGAIKNFGMGGVTKETKIKIHDGSYPVYQKDACTFCGVCAEVCPFQAITVSGESWEYTEQKCFGCSTCVDACPFEALQNQNADLQFLLACSAKACIQDKNVLYLNELKRITKGCDCDPNAGPIICPDIGYLISDDPVAIDKASLDLINNIKENVFKKINKIDPMKQIKYGEEIELGSSSYQLITL